MIAVAAGKGGVGKSSLAVNLALALSRQGHAVGLLDADVYGPSLEQMIPMQSLPRPSEADPDRIIPGERAGIRMITTAHFSSKEAAIVRAPVANAIIDQFLNKIEWGPLDFLIVDFPPGTGDVQLTLMQKGSFSGALLVTTPQEVALLDVRKAAQMFHRMHIPLLGVVENMSYFEDSTGTKNYLFGREGGQKLARELGAPFLGEIPLDPELAQAGDRGASIFETAPDSPSAAAFTKIAGAVQEQLALLPQGDFTAELLADGTLSVAGRHFTPAALQKRCPCIKCGGQGKSAENVGVIQLQKMGRYALKVIFTSGCSQGIYPLKLLQEIA